MAFRLRYVGFPSFFIVLISVLQVAVTCDSAMQSILAPQGTTIGFSAGFSLHPTHGALTIIFDDGETVSYTSEGNSEYRNVMTKLSLRSSTHLAPPYKDPGDILRDIPRVGARHERKSLGLPASPEVGAISTTIANVRNKAQSALGIPITSATIAVPHLVALYQDDVQDAFEYLGLEYLHPHRYYSPLLWDSAASFAGYGFGLCSNWKDEEKCDLEDRAMPDVTLLVVNYSEDALITTFSEIKTATMLWEPDNRHRENFELGSKRKADFGDDEAYWEKVRQELKAMMVQNRGYPKPTRILISGKEGRDAVFQENLRKAMAELMSAVPEVFMDGSDVVASKGAAEFARRIL